MYSVKEITLNNGVRMPAFGLGTYCSYGGDCERAVKYAIDIGYRHFDTAYFYENESEVGKAIKDKINEGIIKREDVFIVTKLWSHFHDPDKVEYACRKSLENFGLDYVDLYLMHWPFGYIYKGDNVMFPTNKNGETLLSDVDYLDTWRAMENLISLGLCKSIGVSNFNIFQLNRLLDSAKINPVHNQIECHPLLVQHELIQFCMQKNIVVTAYCPLGRPDPVRKHPEFLYNEKVKKIADKYKKSTAQVVLRYLVQLGVVPIPKSVNNERIKENIEIFDFELDENEKNILSSFNKGQRLVPMTNALNSKYYPFADEFN